MTERTIIGARIFDLRGKKAMSRRELADLSGVSLRTIEGVENDGKLPGWGIACKLADALGVSIDVFRRLPPKV